jgi:hypothetical protein
MKVVGVATTLAPDLLKQHTQWVIPDFTNLPKTWLTVNG